MRAGEYMGWRLDLNYSEVNGISQLVFINI